MQNNRTGKRLKTLAADTCAMAYAFIVTGATAYADESDQIVTSIKAGLGQVYKTLTAIVLPIAAVVLVIAGIRMLVSTDSVRGGEQMKHTLIILVVALAVIYLAPLLITTISGWFSSYSNASGIFT